MSTEQLGEARSIQQRLESYYALESGPDVAQFVKPAAEGCRESVLVRQAFGEMQIAVMLPSAQPKQRTRSGVCDHYMQVVEGVSHFVHLAERARTELPTTQLELELQAEVDKFVVLALSDESIGPGRARSMHEALYQRVRLLHPPQTELGTRYRLANRLAARLAARLLRKSDRAATRETLRRFYRLGQSEKIRLAQG